jgi:hypothetical protein
VMILLALLIYWFTVFVFFSPSFRLRKLRKLYREDMMEYNELLADISRKRIEKADEKLQYEKLIVQKDEINKEITKINNLKHTYEDELKSKAEAVEMLNEFLATKEGNLWLKQYVAKKTAESALKESDETSEEKPEKVKKGKGSK